MTQNIPSPLCLKCGVEKNENNTKMRKRRDGSKAFFSLCVTCQREYKRVWKQKKGK